LQLALRCRGARPADALIQKGKAPARQLLKARILFKADASGTREAWSDSRVAAALETSLDTIVCTRQQLDRVHPPTTRPGSAFSTAPPKRS
jgi:hypothetical protein